MSDGNVELWPVDHERDAAHGPLDEVANASWLDPDTPSTSVSDPAQQSLALEPVVPEAVRNDDQPDRPASLERAYDAPTLVPLTPLGSAESPVHTQPTDVLASSAEFVTPAGPMTPEPTAMEHVLAEHMPAEHMPAEHMPAEPGTVTLIEPSASEQSAAAAQLEALARRVRAGEITLAHGATTKGEAAVLAAVLAALLGGRD